MPIGRVAGLRRSSTAHPDLCRSIASGKALMLTGVAGAEFTPTRRACRVSIKCLPRLDRRLGGELRTPAGRGSARLRSLLRYRSMGRSGPLLSRPHNDLHHGERGPCPMSWRRHERRQLSLRSRANLGRAPEHLSRASLRGRCGGCDCGSRVWAGYGEALSRSAVQGEVIRPCRSRHAAIRCDSPDSETVPAGHASGQRGEFKGEGCRASPSHRSGGAGFFGWAH